MEFKEIIEHLRKEENCRRRSWPDGRFIFWACGRHILDQNARFYDIDGDDIFADDWEVLE